MSFTVFRSSAGSGKTYTLVREYLKLVLKQPDNFRHVLAITFTNKAANEMKERIVRVLTQLTEHSIRDEDNKKDREYLEGLAAETGLDTMEVVSNARLVLNNILHNYTDFAVSTIDSFIHRIIRSFAFDLNVPVNFEVEMDTDEVLKQVIDIMISRVGSDPVLTRFLVEFVKARADEEKNWNVEDDLMKVARLVKKESSAAHLERNAALGIDDYMKIQAAINKFMAAYETRISSLAEETLLKVHKLGLSPRAFYRGEQGIYNYFKKLAKKSFDAVRPNSYVTTTIEEDKWTSGRASKEEVNAIHGLVPELKASYLAIRKEVETHADDYVLFGEVKKTIYPMAFLGKVNHILEEFKAENNILLISEFNQLIADIVLDEPVPFIYERVGEKYHHFLLDEFQDTSVLQWQNLVPLLENSLAQGYGNLVVGDAKQAIYRWRNGEVEQFISLPKIYGRREGQVHLERELTLAEHFEGKSLDHNYRSRPGIVSFNNGFFRWLSRHISEKEASVYESVSQQIATTAKGGQVQIEFFPPDREDIDFKDHNRKRVLEIILETCDRGYRFEDIAILCRTNKEAAIIAKDLLTHAVQVVSSESMLLKSSPKVRLLAGIMRLLVEPRDEPVQMEVVNLLLKTGKVSGSLHSLGIRALSKGNRGKQNFTGGLIFGFLKESGFALERTSLLALPLYDLCEALMRIFGIDGEPDPFLQFFLDLVLEREDEGGSGIRKFLEYWDRKKESLSIVVPEGLDAVRIMTIHKAKGLEFPVVIYPFVNDRLSVNKDPLWMEMDSPVVPGLGSVLVNPNKSVRETRYGHVVEREIEKIQLDMVNLLYVAFTRPTDELYVIVQHPENMKRSQFSVPAMLLEYLEELNPERPDPLIFRLGSRGNVDRSGKSPGPSYSLDAFNSVDWRSRALISYQAPSNWDVDQPGGRQEWGNLIHRILSEITIAADLMPVLDDYLYHGNVDAREQQLLREMILEFLERPEVGTYFKPGLRVWKEAEIIAPGGALFRPDRIVEVGGECVVIDFKTGTPSNKHRDQMQQYLDLMRAMMDTPVRGVVLYLDPHAPLHVE